MRILVKPARSFWNARQLKLLQRLLHRLSVSLVLMQDDGFRDLLAHAHHRVQRSERLLKDDRDIIAANLAHLRRIEFGQIAHLPVPSAKIDRARTQFRALVIGEPKNRARSDGLAGTRFAHHRHGLASADRKAHVDHCRNVAVNCREHSRKAVNGENGRAGWMIFLQDFGR